MKKIVVNYSGGKDSTACLRQLVEKILIEYLLRRYDYDVYYPGLLEGDNTVNTTNRYKKFLEEIEKEIKAFTLTKKDIIPLPISFKLYVDGKEKREISVKEVIPQISAEYIYTISKEKFEENIPF